MDTNGVDRRIGITYVIDEVSRSSRVREVELLYESAVRCCLTIRQDILEMTLLFTPRAKIW
jgi:hypothetical protein